MTTARYRFNIDALWEVAALKGDSTGAEIANRTGLSEGAISRILSRKRQPKLDSAAIIAATYETKIDDLVEAAA